MAATRNQGNFPLSEERGFTLVEMLVAMLVLIAGLAATFTIFTSSKNLTLVSQRHEVAVHQAQKEMEKLRALDYAELGMESDPVASSDPRDPGCRVTQNGTKLRVMPVAGQACQQASSTDESFVLQSDVPGGVVEPGPEAFYAGEVSGSVVSGKVYRYITWRDENCTAVCLGEKDTKRLVVAVTLDPVAGASGSPRPIGPRNPIWITSIATDPNEGALGDGQQGPPPPPPPASSVQSFYLYDKQCSDSDAGTDNSYSPPTGSHATHDTASPGTSCENPASSKRPDLMGPTLPAYSNPPSPPYKFAELGGDWPAGLALSHEGATTNCPVSSYELDTVNAGESPPDPSTPGKWQVHAWSTKKFTADFNLVGRAFLTVWATSVNTVSATGRFCATLVDRKVTAGVPNDIALGSTNQSYTPWPTTKSEPSRQCGPADYPCGRQLTFQFSVGTDKVRSGGRLVLLLSILGTSAKDIVFLYDDPRYRSFVQLETATPCSSTGTPCGTT